MNGSRRAIWGITPHTWATVIVDNRCVSHFVNAVYETMPKKWKNKYGYKLIITRYKCWVSLGFSTILYQCHKNLVNEKYPESFWSNIQDKINKLNDELK